MELFICLFLIIILFSIKINKEDNLTPLSKDNSIALKGIMAIVVLFHHISQNVKTPLTGALLFAGPIAVSVFFFVSGYGLMKSFKTKEGYLNNFINHRILPILIQFLIMNILYYIFRLIIGDGYSVIEFLKSFINGKTTMYYGWYILEIIVLYIVFYIACKVFNKKHNNIVLFTLFATIIMNIIMYIAGYDTCWYRSNLCLTMGMFTALKEHKINKLISKRKALSIFVLSITFVIGFILCQFIDNRILNCILFQLTLLVLQLDIYAVLIKFSFKGKIINWLGKNSLYIYILQAIPIYFMKYVYMINNPYLYTFIVINATIILAYIYKGIEKFIYNLKK